MTETIISMTMVMRAEISITYNCVTRLLCKYASLVSPLWIFYIYDLWLYTIYYNIISIVGGQIVLGPMSCTKDMNEVLNNISIISSHYINALIHRKHYRLCYTVYRKHNRLCYTAYNLFNYVPQYLIQFVI